MRRMWRHSLVAVLCMSVVLLEGCDDEDDGPKENEPKEPKESTGPEPANTVATQAQWSSEWSGERERNSGGPAANVAKFDQTQKSVGKDQQPGKGTKLLEAERAFERALIANNGAENEAWNMKKQQHLEEWLATTPTTTSSSEKQQAKEEVLSEQKPAENATATEDNAKQVAQAANKAEEAAGESENTPEVTPPKEELKENKDAQTGPVEAKVIKVGSSAGAEDPQVEEENKIEAATQKAVSPPVTEAGAKVNQFSAEAADAADAHHDDLGQAGQAGQHEAGQPGQPGLANQHLEPGAAAEEASKDVPKPAKDKTKDKIGEAGEAGEVETHEKEAHKQDQQADKQEQEAHKQDQQADKQEQEAERQEQEAERQEQEVERQEQEAERQEQEVERQEQEAAKRDKEAAKGRNPEGPAGEDTDLDETGDMEEQEGGAKPQDGEEDEPNLDSELNVDDEDAQHSAIQLTQKKAQQAQHRLHRFQQEQNALVELQERQAQDRREPRPLARQQDEFESFRKRHKEMEQERIAPAAAAHPPSLMETGHGHSRKHSSRKMGHWLQELADAVA